MAFPIPAVDQSPREDAERAARAGRLPLAQRRARQRNGRSRARNIAWRRVHAEWIAFVDDDCLVHPSGTVVKGTYRGLRETW